MNRLLTLLFALGLLAGPTFGQTADNPSDPAPAEYTFRFVADDGAKYAAHINELIAGLEREER